MNFGCLIHRERCYEEHLNRGAGRDDGANKDLVSASQDAITHAITAHFWPRRNSLQTSTLGQLAPRPPVLSL